MAEPITDRWRRTLTDSVPACLDSLAVAGEAGRYLPCREGRTRWGDRLELGFSCFALKLEALLGRWDARREAERQAWIQCIAGHQSTLPDDRGAFVDPALRDYHAGFHPAKAVVRRLRGQAGLREALPGILLAETKQAVATLAEVGAAAPLPYSGIAANAEALAAALRALDWRQPWSAGGQASGLAALTVIEAPRLGLDSASLRDACATFFASVNDESTGAWFAGERPAQGQLINGAMKVMTALDWLEEPIARPERLMATCLEAPPRSAGCHLVDWVYVVYRCVKQEPALRDLAADPLLATLELMAAHVAPDGGMSYEPGRSQTRYYGVPIARGLPVSDLHGTLLLAWAAVMALELLDGATPPWRVFRP